MKGQLKGVTPKSVNSSSISVIAGACAFRSTHMKRLTQSHLLIFALINIFCNHA